MEERLRKLIVLVGDEGSKFELRDTKKVYEVLDQIFTKKENQQVELANSILIKAISQIPSKQHIYALLTALISQKHEAISQSLIIRIFGELQTLINQGKLYPSKNIFVYFAELMNINLMNSIIFLGLLEDVVNQLEKNTVNMKMFYLQLLVKSLPYCWKGLQTKVSHEFKKLLQRIKKNLDGLTQKSQIQQFWFIFLDLYNYNKLKDESKVSKLSNNQNLQKLTQFHPQLKLKFVQKNTVYQFTNLSLIEIEQEDELYKEFNQSIEAYIHRENIRNIIYAFKKSRRLLVQKLVLYILNSDNSFLSKFLIETLFKQALSQSHQQTVIYSSLLVQLSNENDQNLRKDFRRSIQETALSIFNKLEQYDIKFLDKFADIISFYVANCAQTWDWSKWVENQQKYTKREAFLKLMFEKIGLLAESILTKQNTKDISKFISEKKINMVIRDSKEDLSYISKISEKLSQKCDSEKMIEYINNLNQFEIFQESLMQRMSNSITHLNILSERYKKVFIHFSELGQKYQRIIISKINDFWSFSQFHKIQYFTLFIQKQIINIESFVQWVSLQAKMSDDVEKILLRRVFDQVFAKVGESFENKQQLEQLQQSLTL